jgi:UDP-N-acetylglucosamine--N-acetylmuramyl-(pentapeptide) pyrophosphoryl-undecaprenol N-acetylglucosamine transferase
LRNLLRTQTGVRQCTALLREFAPDVVFITGGYVTAPLAQATWRYRDPVGVRIPLLIYLPDLTPGLAIRMASRQADRVAVSFSEAASHFGPKAVVTGYPVRSDLLRADKTSARAALRLAPDRPVLLVFGGSRGSHSINAALVESLPRLLPRWQVVHISGQLDWEWIEGVRQEQASAAHGDNYHAYPYLHNEMVQAIAAADLVVARAGASTLGEFPAAGLPSILVPYPYAGQHQYANAKYLADRGAALIVDDAELSARLAPTVLELLDSPERLAAMSQAATALARPDAASNIAAELKRLAAGVE